MDKIAFEKYNSIRGVIGGVLPLTQILTSLVQQTYPHFLSLVTDPNRFRSQPSLSPWMSVGSEPISKREISIEFVASKLTFCAAYLSMVGNSEQGNAVRLFVLNSSFFALTQNYLATANSNGLTVIELSKLIVEMKNDGKRLGEGPHVNQSAYDWIVPGVAFVLAHELAHAVGGSFLKQPPHSEVLHWCLGLVKHETNADLCAVAMLLWCIDASGFPEEQKRQQRDNLFQGIRIVLLGMRALDSISGKVNPGVYGDKLVYSNGFPTPFYRGKLIDDFSEVLISLDAFSTDSCDSKSLLKKWLDLETKIARHNRW